MIGKFLKGLFSGSGEAGEPEPAEPIEHGGFAIVAAPRQVQGGWSTEGVISKTIDGEERRAHFIRADTAPTREDAIELARAKGRKIVDEQGDGLFSS